MYQNNVATNMILSKIFMTWGELMLYWKQMLFIQFVPYYFLKNVERDRKEMYQNVDDVLCLGSEIFSPFPTF
jgi:hypothetical protein